MRNSRAKSFVDVRTDGVLSDATDHEESVVCRIQAKKGLIIRGIVLRSQAFYCLLEPITVSAKRWMVLCFDPIEDTVQEN